MANCAAKNWNPEIGGLYDFGLAESARTLSPGHEPRRCHHVVPAAYAHRQLADKSFSGAIAIFKHGADGRPLEISGTAQQSKLSIISTLIQSAMELTAQRFRRQYADGVTGGIGMLSLDYITQV